MKKMIKNYFYGFKRLLGLILCFSFLFALSGCERDVKVEELTATLTWDAPTTNFDAGGTPLIDLLGYKIYYGTASGSYGTPIDKQLGSAGLTCLVLTNPDRTECTYTVTGLNSGTKYWFAVTAYDTSNNESAYSDEVSKTIP